MLPGARRTDQRGVLRGLDAVGHGRRGAWRDEVRLPRSATARSLRSLRQFDGGAGYSMGAGCTWRGESGADESESRLLNRGAGDANGDYSGVALVIMVGNF